MLVKAKTGHLHQILDLMEGERHLGDLFVIDTVTWVKKHLSETWVWEANGMAVAYLYAHIPGKDKNNMAKDLDIPKSEWSKVAYLDSSVVKPEYRGNHIMQTLMREAMKDLRSRGFIHIFATVHPDNISSRRSLEASGFTCYDTKEMYTGLVRCCMYLKLD